MIAAARLSIVVLALASGCARPAPRAPIALPNVTNIDSNIDSNNSNIHSNANSNRVVIMSMRDVAPYEYVPPREPEPPPPIEVGAPLYGALAGMAMGVVLNTGLTLLAEHRWPDGRKRDRDRAERAALYGAGIGLVGGSLTLADSIAQRMKWREREKQRAAQNEKATRRAGREVARPISPRSDQRSARDHDLA
jgi:hypothetical protein